MVEFLKVLARLTPEIPQQAPHAQGVLRTVLGIEPHLKHFQKLRAWEKVNHRTLPAEVLLFVLEKGTTDFPLLEYPPGQRILFTERPCLPQDALKNGICWHSKRSVKRSRVIFSKN